MLRVLYPGTFDPPTNGHLDVVQRSAQIFDTIEIVIANNPLKRCFFDVEERYEMLSELTAGTENVKIHVWDGLIVDFAEKLGVKVILRGVRALSDFDYEFELSLTYKTLNPKIETIFMPTDQKYLVLRSSTIKELAMFNGDISQMVPPLVVKALKEKLKGGVQQKLDTGDTMG
jgi:pantetheine-phosphate adenylyltransferase